MQFPSAPPRRSLDGGLQELLERVSRPFRGRGMEGYGKLGAGGTPPKKLEFQLSYSGFINPPKESFRPLDVLLHNSAPIPATELYPKTRSFILSGYGSDPRFLGGGYEGLKFPRKSGNSSLSPVSRFSSTRLLVTQWGGVRLLGSLEQRELALVLEVDV